MGRLAATRCRTTAVQMTPESKRQVDGGRGLVRAPAWERRCKTNDAGMAGGTSRCSVWSPLHR